MSINCLFRDFGDLYVSAGARRSQGKIWYIYNMYGTLYMYSTWDRYSKQDGYGINVIDVYIYLCNQMFMNM